MAEERDRSVIQYTLNQPMAGAMCGVAVIVLAILGLVHVFPVPLAALATIIFGAALLVKGVLISTEYSKILSYLSGSKLDKFELGGGMSLEIITGLAGIVLGILAVVHLASVDLVAIALIIFGVGVIMGSGVLSRLNALKLEVLDSSSGQIQSRIIHDLVSIAVGTQILAGFAAIILGIFSLLGFAPMTLNLVALLVLGADFILSGSAVSEKLLGQIRG